jgi:hypothetical protein
VTLQALTPSIDLTKRTLKGQAKALIWAGHEKLPRGYQEHSTKGLDGYDVPKHVTLGNHEDRIWSYTNKNPEIVDYA